MAMSKNVNECFSFVTGYLKPLDAQPLKTYIGGFGQLLSETGQALKSLARTNNAIYSKLKDVIFYVRQVLVDILDKCRELRSYRNVAVDAFCCVKSEFEFSNMSIEDFLKENKLEKYADIFDEEGIIYARELFDVDINGFQKDMEPIPFNRLKEKLRKVESVRTFLREEMESKMERASDKCNKTSKSVNDKLTKALDNLASVAKDLMKSVDNETFKATIWMCVWWALALVIALIAILASGGLAVVGVGAVALGAVGGAIKVYDLAQLQTLKENVDRQTSTEQENLQKTFLGWNMLITTLNQLLNQTREAGAKVTKLQCYDMKSHLEETDKFLKTFDEEITKFEDDIEKVVRS